MAGGRRAGWTVLLAAILLTGCWDRREIDERSNILMVGVDLCAEGEDCHLVETRQIAIPGRIPLGTAGGEGGGGADEETVVVIRSTGRDGVEATRNAQPKLNRPISVAHQRVLVASEAFAREGVGEYLDYLRRVPEIRRLMWVAVVEGRAEDLVRARPLLERVPALFVDDMLDDAVRTGRLPEIFVGEFLIRVSNLGEDAAAPLLRMVGPDRPQLAGLAVFRGDRMVGKLNQEETVTYMQLRGLRRGAESLRVPLPGDREAVLRVNGRKATYRLGTAGGRITCDITIEMESELVKLSSGLRGSDPAVLEEIQGRAAADVSRKAEALVAKLQSELGADILALGERVRAYMPGVWKQIGDWSEAFPEARIRVRALVSIRRTGLATE